MDFVYVMSSIDSKIATAFLLMLDDSDMEIILTEKLEQCAMFSPIQVLEMLKQIIPTSTKLDFANVKILKYFQEQQLRM